MINYISYEYSFLFIILLLGIPALVAYVVKNKHVFNYIKRRVIHIEKNKTFMHHIYYIFIIFIMNVVLFNCSLGNLFGGYVFGLTMGSILTCVGCMLAAMFSFFLSKYYLADFFKNMFKKNSIFGSYYKKFDHTKLSKNDTIELVALSRLSPQAPFQIFNLFWGTMKVSPYDYFIGSLAILPIIIFETFLGTQVKNLNKIFKSGNKWTGIACLIITLGIIWLIDKKIQEVINKEIDK